MNLHIKAPVVWAGLCLTVFSLTGAIGQEPALLA